MASVNRAINTTKDMKTANKIIRIIQDTDPESPRTWCNLGTIAYKHRRYKLGEEEISDPIEWLEDMLNKDRAYVYTNERLQQLGDEFLKKYIALPIFIYDHSGITISTSSFTCRWDSGQVGYIYASLDDVRKEYGVKRVSKKTREKVVRVLQSEIDAFDQYLTGDVYGFIIEDEDGNHIDSCWGFFGSNPMENGMSCHIERELWPLLENAQVEY